MDNCKYHPLSIEAWNTFTGDYEDSPEVNALKRQILDSAIQIVEDYLHYPIRSCEHTEELTGLEARKVYLHAMPVEYVNSVVLNGKELNQDIDYVFDKDSIYLTRKPCKDDEIIVSYSAGWSADRIPPIIIQTVYRIATLLKTEGNQNISVTSVSYSDGSRSFVNFTNFDKYLRPLMSLRAVRL